MQKSENRIPSVDFYGTQITRLILGDNPFTGHSYIEDIHSGEEMKNYYTAEKCVRALFEAEENGINAYMALADPFILRVIRQYRNEGGKMHIMFQSYPVIDLEVNIRQIMESSRSQNIDISKLLTPKGVRMTVTMVTVTPVLFIYPFLQKYFVKGIMIGAVKG